MHFIVYSFRVWTHFDLYLQYGYGGFPYWEVLGLLPCACACLVNFRVPIFGTFIALYALYDSGSIIYGYVVLGNDCSFDTLLTTRPVLRITGTCRQLQRWWMFGMQLYVNELMVKKLSTFGAVIVVMLIYYRVSTICMLFASR